MKKNKSESMKKTKSELLDQMKIQMETNRLQAEAIRQKEKELQLKERELKLSEIQMEMLEPMALNEYIKMVHRVVNAWENIDTMNRMNPYNDHSGE